MTGSAESYFSAFAVFLRASTAQVGLLATLPPLLASLMQPFSAWLGRRLGRRKPLIVAGALLQALALIPLVWLPGQYPDYAMVLLILAAVVYFSGPNLGTPQWGSLMGDLVPENRRGRFFARRTRLCSLASFGALTGAGLVLHGFERANVTYWGFVLIFSFASLARLISAYHLARMVDPPGHTAALDIPWRAGFWQRLRQTPLVRFSLFFAAMQFSVSVASPYFALYMLRDLQFNYLEFMINASASVGLQILTLQRWGRLSDLFGNRLILLTTGSLIPLLPLLWLVSTSFWYLLLVQALSGLCWAGFTLSATNTLFDMTPPNRRAGLMAAHNVLAAVAVFSGAVVGGYLGTHLPTTLVFADHTWSWFSSLYPLFVLSGLLRIGVVCLFLPHLQEVRRVRPMSVSGVLFRVTRIRPFGGLLFDVIGGRRSGRDEPDS